MFESLSPRLHKMSSNIRVMFYTTNRVSPMVTGLLIKKLLKQVQEW